MLMRTSIHRIQRLAVAAVVASIALSVGMPVGAQELQRVEEVWGDAGPLNTSLRALDVDMRQPSNFEHVYRVPGSHNLLSRLDGGLAAVFPRSIYAATRGGGVMPVIPPGTVFYVGGMPSAPSERIWGWQSGGRRGAGPGVFRPQPVERSIARSIARPSIRGLLKAPVAPPSVVRGTNPSAAPPVGAGSIWTADFHRRDMIAKLLGISDSK